MNTGYNHGSNSVYLQPTSQSQSVPDRYWTVVSSAAAPVPPTAAFVTPLAAGGWANPLLNSSLVKSQWIGVTWNGASPPISGPSYYVYRKCFCLRPGYTHPRLSYQLRGDETTQVWLGDLVVNYHSQTLSGPSGANFGMAPLSFTTGQIHESWFHTGVNCLYVLVGDNGGATGFNLAGEVTVTGLAVACVGPGTPACPP